MKFLVLFVTVICLGTSEAQLRWLSSLTSTVSETSTAVRQTAVGVAKTTTNQAANVAKTTQDHAVSATKATVNLALTAAETAKNVTVNTVMAGVDLVKNISMSAVNTGVGYLLAEIKRIVRRTGKNVISIPDIYQKAGVIHFNATQGYFKDITTIVQAGKPNVTTNGTSLKIDVPLKLDEIDIGFDQFNVTMLKMKMGGGIKVHIKNDTFVAHLRLTPGFKCALNLEKVEVTILAGYDIDFFNMGKKSEKLLEKSSTVIMNALKSNIKSRVQAAIDSSIKSAIKEDSTICSKFLG